MPEPRHRTDVTPAASRASVGRAWLVVLVVVAAFLAPAVATTAADRAGSDRSDRSIGARPQDPGHLLPTVRAARVGREAHTRTVTPFGTVPGGAVLAVVLLLFVTLATRATVDPPSASLVPPTRSTAPPFRRLIRAGPPPGVLLRSGSKGTWT